MTLGLKDHDGTIGRVDGAAIELYFAERATVGTGQLWRNVGHGFSHHPLLNAAAQDASDGVGSGLDLTEMNGPASAAFGGLEIGGRFGGLPHQTVQFFLESFDFVIHDIDSGAKLQANASLRAFMPPILTEVMQNLLPPFSSLQNPCKS
jgi:hypothetical protein